MSIAELRVGYFDQYYDIPLRGVMRGRDGWEPFLAEVDEGAPEEAWTEGIPTTLQVFPPTPDMGELFETVTTSFNEWNSKFRRGEVKEDSHPLTVDSAYKATIAEIDERFRALGNKPVTHKGWFSVHGGEWCFRPDPNA
jgi:hypothetical protein